MTSAIVERREIAPGVYMPILGFGTAYLPVDKCESICTEAIRAGWRHIDAAINYRNQASVGAAIKNCGVDRTEMFVTTKIMNPPDSYDPQEVYDAVLAGVAQLDLDFVDLFLIHTAKLGGPRQRKVVWQALERLLKNGKTRAIGLSNFGKGHLAEIVSYCQVKPACNQIELHPWCQPASHIKAFEAAGIQLVAYSAIVQGLHKGLHMDDPAVQRMALKYEKDAAGILLRWSLQKGFIPVVRCTSPEHIKSNLEVLDFCLSDEEVRQLDAKQTGDPPTGKTYGSHGLLDCP